MNPDASRTDASGSPPAGRRIVTWVASLLAAAVLLWLASKRFPLWPDALVVRRPTLLWAAVAMHVPYALVRALRLRYLLDPLVAAASGGQRRRLSRALLYGSGLLSFFVIILLPFKLGELSRPLLLARGREPGVRFTEGVTSVAVERVIDGLMICALLFGGLALADAGDSGDVDAVRRGGRVMLAVFAVGLVVLLVLARRPALTTRLLQATAGRLGESIRERATSIVERFTAAIRTLYRLEHAVPLLAWSLVYWVMTVVQLWLVLHACGLDLGLAAASAIVAIVGLSIQLPLGPAQAGQFQIGMAAAFAVFLTDAQAHGPGSTFAALMYVLQVGGAAVLAVPGALLLQRGRRSGDPAPS